MRIAVTGASGFVGGAVARDLVAAGHEVQTFARRPVGVTGVRHRAWDLVAGPLPDPPEVDVVVHAAAMVSDGDDRDRAWRVNVEGTRAVRETFPAARFVHVSSGSVYDPFTPSVLAREDSAPVERYLNAYGESKAAAERYLTADAGPGRGAVVVLRPHAVYGPGDTTLLPRIEHAVRGGTLLLPGGGAVRQHLTHVDVLARAVRASAVLPEPTARAADGALVVNVADAAPVVLADALRDVLARRGRSVTIRSVPSRPVWALAALVERVARRIGREDAPRLTRYALSHLAMERTYDLAVLRGVLGVEPTPTSFEGAETW